LGHGLGTFAIIDDHLTLGRGEVRCSAVRVIREKLEYFDGSPYSGQSFSCVRLCFAKTTSGVETGWFTDFVDSFVPLCSIFDREGLIDDGIIGETAPRAPRQVRRFSSPVAGLQDSFETLEALTQTARSQR
jgi:hypothetical protein